MKWIRGSHPRDRGSIPRTATISGLTPDWPWPRFGGLVLGWAVDAADRRGIARRVGTAVPLVFAAACMAATVWAMPISRVGQPVAVSYTHLTLPTNREV